ncbi:hypothetical protein ACJMK2_007195 [Sinanodonta woodiana]|uniref:Uncharacterized protein n=1 Tax=Sinanodonta woodiana TaxID=1069815 RepID=A0ABD3VHR2_SINWO
MGTSSSRGQAVPKKDTPVKTEVQNVEQIHNITETTGKDNEEHKEQDNNIKENYQMITDDKAMCLPNDNMDAVSVDSKDSGDTYSMFKKCQFYPELHKENNSNGLVMKYVRSSYTSNATKGKRPKDSKPPAPKPRNKAKQGSLKMTSTEYSSNNISGDKYQMIFITKGKVRLLMINVFRDHGTATAVFTTSCCIYLMSCVY